MQSRGDKKAAQTALGKTKEAMPKRSISGHDRSTKTGHCGSCRPFMRGTPHQQCGPRRGIHAPADNTALAVVTLDIGIASSETVAAANTTTL